MVSKAYQLVQATSAGNVKAFGFGQTSAASAALHRSVTSQHFLDEVIEDATVKAIMERVIVKPYRVDPALDDLSPEAPDVIRVYLNNGTE